jgi:hypothetical protein
MDVSQYKKSRLSRYKVPMDGGAREMDDGIGEEGKGEPTTSLQPVTTTQGTKHAHTYIAIRPSR